MWFGVRRPVCLRANRLSAAGLLRGGHGHFLCRRRCNGSDVGWRMGLRFTCPATTRPSYTELLPLSSVVLTPDGHPRCSLPEILCFWASERGSGSYRRIRNLLQAIWKGDWASRRVPTGQCLACIDQDVRGRLGVESIPAFSSLAAVTPQWSQITDKCSP